MEIKLGVSLADWLATHYPTILQEFQTTHGLTFIVKGILLDEKNWCAIVDGRTVTLTRPEMALLRALWDDGGYMDNSEICRAIWHEHYLFRVDDPRIWTLISRVRSKIETDPRHPAYLIGTRKKGYKLQR